MKIGVRIRGAGLALAVLMCIAACGGRTNSGSAAKSPMDIGMVVALTGYLAATDGPYVDGVKLAVNRVNAQGGADGHKIQLHVADGASSPTTGVTATNQLINQYQLSAMINGASSATNQALVPVVASRRVPVLSQAQLPDDTSWTFLAVSSYKKDLELQLAYAAKQLHAKSVAFLYSQTPYGQDGAKLLTTAAPALGMKIATSLAVDASLTDLSPVMAKVKDANPDVIVDFLTGSTHIVEAKGAATAGLNIPIVMGQDATAPIRQATQAYPNIHFVATPAQVYPNINNTQLKAACKTFVDAYQKSGKDPSLIGTAGFGWDAVQMIVAAVKSAHSTDGSKIKAALEKEKLQGSEFLYKFSPQDHSGQDNVPNSLVIGQTTGTTIKSVYTVT